MASGCPTCTCTKKDAKVCSSIILFIIFSVPLLALTLFLGIYGVVQAQMANTCAAQNLTELASGCVPEFTILTAKDEGSTNVDTVWTHWLGGAIGAGLFWAVVQTIACVILIACISPSPNNENQSTSTSYEQEMTDASRDSKENQSKSTSNKQEMTDRDASSPSSQEAAQEQDESVVTFETHSKVKKKKIKAKSVRRFTLGAGFGLFFSLLFAAFAVLCLLWAIGISYFHAQRSDVTVATYVVVEFLAGIVMPICLFVSGTLMSAVLDFITRGMVNLKVSKFLPVVKFETGTTKGGKVKNYWVIEETFYFEVPPHNHKENKFTNSFDRCWSTWLLNWIVCLGVHLALAVFIDITLVTQTTLDGSTECDTIDSTYRCFFAGSLESAECEEVNATTAIHCFKFLQFGMDFDLILAVISAYVAYTVTSTVFTYVFSVAKNAMLIQPSKLWGLGFIIVGVLGFIGVLILAVFWLVGYTDDDRDEILHFTIISLAELFMITLYIVIVGVLLVVAKWWENDDGSTSHSADS